jgi:uncharacterized protein (TIGR02300 family)
MADKKFGQKRVCTNCDVKFYDLNKKSPFKCPHCGSEILIEDNNIIHNEIVMKQQQNKKDEFSDLEHSDNVTNEDEEVISIDEVALEEEQDTKN